MTPSRETLVDLLRVLVEAETPTGDTDALNRGFSVLAELTASMTARQPLVDSLDGTPYLYLAPTASPSVLFLGHLDTVWPVGTLSELPFRIDGDVATGPGVFDMKAGLAIALGAIAGCNAADHVGLLVTSDEETGSTTGRTLVEKHATAASAVFVPEPAAPGGAIKVARKGVGLYEFQVVGREAHAGLEPERGVNASMELASLINDIAGLADPEAGTTVTPTRAASGLTSNTVPAAATLTADVRAWTLLELQRVDAAVRRRTTHVPGAEVFVSGGINRPPLEAGNSTELLALAMQSAVDTGLGQLEATGVGGGSDGNFTSAAGIPTLDGVGAVGGGAHARDEWVDLTSLEPRARWLASVAERFVAQHPDSAGR